MIEGGLRLTGIGAPDASEGSRLKYQQLFLPILELAERPDGVTVWRPSDRRLAYQTLLKNKPSAGLRVFTFGGSATAGLGFSPNVTVARELQRVLRAAYPGLHIEVMNLGIVALSTNQVRLLVDEVCRSYEPDLILVYAGNNEFLELHAEKYFDTHADALTRGRHRLMRTNLYRFMSRAIRGARRRPTLAEQNLSREDLQLTQSEIIRDIALSAEEVAGAIDRYERNIDAMAESAVATGTPILLSTVASNWKWRGRSDLPNDWIEMLLGQPAAAELDLRHALALVDNELAASATSERHAWLFKRAELRLRMGDFGSARDDYRAAMNEDPHLRRALDAMNDRVRAVAQRRGAALLDVVDLLSRAGEHGIVGFDDFYDYVHLTPRGTVRIAGEAFRTMQRMGVLPPAPDFDAAAFERNRLARLSAVSQDPLDVTEWMGFGFDRTRIFDRDLWKYDRLVEDLDRHIAQNPADVRALTYRGNAYSFEIDAAAQAERDYLSALTLQENAVVRSNLQRLLTERAL